jgi:hypothetical protein
MSQRSASSLRGGNISALHPAWPTESLTTVDDTGTEMRANAFMSSNERGRTEID